jgi:xylose isomerase
MGEVIPYSEWAMSAAKTYTDALIKVQAEFLDKLASIPVISEDVNIQSHHEITKATHLYLTEMSDMVMDHTPETEEKLAWKTNALMSVLDEYLLAKFKLVDSAIDVSGYDASYEDIFSEAIYSANLLFWGIDATIYQSLIVKMTNQVNQ